MYTTGDFSVDNSGEPKLSPDKTIEDVVLEIKTRMAKSNPSLRIIHEGLIRTGPIAQKFCTLSEVIDYKDDNAFKHHILDIVLFEKRKRGFFFDVGKKFNLTDKYGEIKLLYEFLKHCYDGDIYVGKEYIIAPKGSLNQATQPLVDEKLVTFFLEDSENYKYLIDIGGISFIKAVLHTAFQSGHSLSALAEIIGVLKESEGSERIEILNTIRSLDLTKSDLDLLSGRKQNLQVFADEIINSSGWLEKDWQEFFESNTWIFGYGLSYKFLRILHREAHLSETNITGNHDVTGDFLLADNCFTILVELKRPDTDLFEMNSNRSGSWRLSSDLTYAVSQILEQKAVWQLKSEKEQFNKDGNPIYQKTYDPKAILVMGNSEQFAGSTQTQRIKAKTFELYRRNLKDIEIVTFDELFERAKFIVNDC